MDGGRDGRSVSIGFYVEGCISKKMSRGGAQSPWGRRVGGVRLDGDAENKGNKTHRGEPEIESKSG